MARAEVYIDSSADRRIRSPFQLGRGQKPEASRPWTMWTVRRLETKCGPARLREGNIMAWTTPTGDTRHPKFYYLSTALPRRCGIATYTADLTKAVEGAVGPDSYRLIALSDQPEGYDYTGPVDFEVRENRLDDYAQAAEYVNFSSADVLSLQHEFGIYGGQAGSHILELLDRLKKPVVSTLHTVERSPSSQRREVLQAVCQRSQRIVVMNPIAVDMLESTYGADRDKIAVIHHGVPDVPFLDPAYYKDTLAIADRTLLLTFGLLHPGKGIEVAIRALPKVVERHPEIVYIVLGATHPAVKRQSGESYRISLERLVSHLGLDNHVHFVNRFLNAQELYEFILASDIYLTPYLAEDQMTSGTLAYAVGMGKAVVSTPYWHAKALLADGRGVLVDFNDTDAMSQAVVDLLDNDAKRHAMRKKAYKFARDMVWSECGKRYADVFEQAVVAFHAIPRSGSRPPTIRPSALPEVKLDHLIRMTDDTGLLRYSAWGIPDRRYGYATIDAARGLVVMVRYNRLFRDATSETLMDRYLSFLSFAQRADGTFESIMRYDRTFEPHDDTAAVRAHCLWALGYCVARATQPRVQAVARQLFEQAMRDFHPEDVRDTAMGLLGLLSYLDRYDGATEVRKRAVVLSERLTAAYEAHANDQWRWFSDRIEVGDARIAEACIRSSMVLERPRNKEVGLSALSFLTEIVDRGEYLDLIGNDGWLQRGGDKPVFSQQPIDAGGFVEAYLTARQATGLPTYTPLALKAFWWFLGTNRLMTPVYDFATGACYDGLNPEGVNQNQGAEATTAFLLAILALLQHRSIPANKGTEQQ